MPAISTPRYVKHERVSLKSSPEFSERWLKDIIVADPSILGLGEVEVRDSERRQPHAGRLDLLLSDPEDETRYEVELMLGPTDESHIIRSIEYWDNEKNRFPNHEHVAVLVAEDITSRFLNVIRLLGRSVPMIAIQLSALKIGDQIALDFVRVIDHSPLPDDDEDAGGAPLSTDREYWIRRVGPKQLEIADALASLFNRAAEANGGEHYELKYLKYHLGLSTQGGFFNVARIEPRKQFVKLRVSLADEGPWFDRVREAGLEATRKPKRLKVIVTARDLEANRALLEELARAVVAEQAG